MESTARPAPLQLSITLESSEEEEESLEKIPLAERTDAYFKQIQTFLKYAKTAQDYYHHFSKTIPQDVLGISVKQTITELIYHLFPETKKGECSPKPETIVEKIHSHISRASRDDVYITLETIAKYMRLKTLKTPNGDEVELSKLKRKISSKNPEKSFHDIVKANLDVLSDFDTLYLNVKINTLPRALSLLPNLTALKFLDCSISELPYWIGELKLDVLGIWSLDDTAFKITRFIGNLTNLVSLKLWTPLAGSLNPIEQLQSLLRLELPELQHELPHELKDLPNIEIIALNRKECSKSL